VGRGGVADELQGKSGFLFKEESSLIKLLGSNIKYYL
jgi:hypothetical protein